MCVRVHAPTHTHNKHTHAAYLSLFTCLLRHLTHSFWHQLSNTHSHYFQPRIPLSYLLTITFPSHSTTLPCFYFFAFSPWKPLMAFVQSQHLIKMGERLIKMFAAKTNPSLHWKKNWVTLWWWLFLKWRIFRRNVTSQRGREMTQIDLRMTGNFLEVFALQLELLS